MCLLLEKAQPTCTMFLVSLEKYKSTATVTLFLPPTSSVYRYKFMNKKKNDLACAENRMAKSCMSFRELWWRVQNQPKKNSGDLG
jgi:hypothetical protein